MQEAIEIGYQVLLHNGAFMTPMCRSDPKPESTASPSNSFSHFTPSGYANKVTSQSQTRLSPPLPTEKGMEKAAEKLRLEMETGRGMWRAIGTLRSGILGEYGRQSA